MRDNRAYHFEFKTKYKRLSDVDEFLANFPTLKCKTYMTLQGWDAGKGEVDT